MIVIRLRSFPYLGSAHRVFNLHVIRSCAPSIFTPFFVVYFLIGLTSLRLSFGVHPFPSSLFKLLHLLQLFSPHGLTISVLLLVFSHSRLSHLPLLLFLHSISPQSSLFPSYIHIYFTKVCSDKMTSFPIGVHSVGVRCSYGGITACNIECCRWDRALSFTGDSVCSV